MSLFARRRTRGSWRARPRRSTCWSRVAPARIAQLQPDARIIAILREPADFLYSLHLQMLQNRSRPSRTCARRSRSRRCAAGESRFPATLIWPQALMYSQRVRYVEQLRRYHAAFAPEQVLVLIYDDFRRDNEATVRRVLRFLGVDDKLALGALERATRRCAVRSERIRSAVRSVSVGQRSRLAHGEAVLALTPGRAVARAGGVLHPRESASSTARRRRPMRTSMLELRRRFKGEVVASAVPRSRSGRDCGAMTASAEQVRRSTGRVPPRAGPRFLHRGPPQVRHDRAVCDAQASPADLHAAVEGAPVVRQRPALPPARPPGAIGFPRSSRSTWRCSRRRSPASLPARPRRCTCGRARRPRTSPRWQPARASSRSCASPRASCTRCTTTAAASCRG